MALKKPKFKKGDRVYMESSLGERDFFTVEKSHVDKMRGGFLYDCMSDNPNFGLQVNLKEKWLIKEECIK